MRAIGIFAVGLLIGTAIGTAWGEAVVTRLTRSELAVACVDELKRRLKAPDYAPDRRHPRAAARLRHRRLRRRQRIRIDAARRDHLSRRRRSDLRCRARWPIKG